jgi:lysophospholipase L1-like esterase
MKKRITSLAAAAALAAAFTIGTVFAPPQAEAAGEAIAFAFAGDSLTSGSTSWLYQLDDPSLVRAGGYAKKGYTTGQVLGAIGPVAADVLVIMLGANDVRVGASQGSVGTNLDQIVAKVGAPRVLLTYLPPSDVTSSGGINRRLQGFAMNRYLTAFAAKRGWMIADPWSSYRASTNGWTSGASADKVHPVSAVSGAVANRLELYIRQAVDGA